MSERRLRSHESSRREIESLLRVVDRDLKDAAVEGVSVDRRFTIAYHAVLQLATIVLRASGYTASGAGHHWIAFQALLSVLGSSEQERVDYFDHCRRKRNAADYDAAFGIAEAELRELMKEAWGFRRDVLEWLKEHHPELVHTE
ncbi:MAG: hypothetical protein JW958_08985 [Candidatus Eisenbacteria bacterium]|nr:hypothetical protein [Candidatus Eisenbacteria bacterium]